MNKLLLLAFILLLSNKANAAIFDTNKPNQPNTNNSQPVQLNNVAGANRSLAAFRKRDLNGDGVISQQEWIDTIGGRNVTTNPQIQSTTPKK